MFVDSTNGPFYVFFNYEWTVLCLLIHRVDRFMLNSELLFLYLLAVRCLPELKFTCSSADAPFSQKQTQEMGKLFGITMLITFAFFFKTKENPPTEKHNKRYQDPLISSTSGFLFFFFLLFFG